MIYVYAITDTVADSIPQIAGMDNQAVELVSGDGVAVAISRHACHTFTPTATEVWRHERVVEALMNDRTVLPARFGTSFGVEQFLRSTVWSKVSVLRSGLDKVRGCVELGLRLLDQSASAGRQIKSAHPLAVESSGRAWMLARLAREQEAQRTRQIDQLAASSIYDPLAALARDACCRVRPHGRCLMSAAYLVPRERTGHFSARVRDLASNHPEIQLLCTGPWPPYNFAPALNNAEYRNA